MRFVGIDIAAEEHVVAIVDESSGVVLKATKFTEDAVGYEKLRSLLGSASECAVVAMEATGHYWQNLFAALVADGFPVALLNPLRTRRYAEEDLARAKTDALDALRIARFAAEKRIQPAAVSDEATQELRALVRHRDVLIQSFGDAQRRLHRMVDLGFPEFTRYVKNPSTLLGTTILAAYPTARAFDGAAPKQIAKLCYDGRHKVGQALATSLIAAAKVSVGAHHGEGYRIQVRHLCEELGLLRRQIRELDKNVHALLERHEVGKLLTTIDGIGPDTAARLVAELGDPGTFKSAAALAAYVGVVPGTSLSGKGKRESFALAPTGHAKLRSGLWMPTLAAIRFNPWLRAFSERLEAAGKPYKVRMVACLRKLLGAIYSVAKNRKAFEPKVAGAIA
jgi:transposase